MIHFTYRRKINFRSKQVKEINFRLKQVKANTYTFSEVGTNNIVPKAQRNKEQRSFQPGKAQPKMRNLSFFLIFEVQHNSCTELFDSIEAQCNSGTAFSYQVQAQPNYCN